MYVVVVIIINVAQHGGSVVGTVASQQEGHGLKSWLGQGQGPQGLSVYSWLVSSVLLGFWVPPPYRTPDQRTGLELECVEHSGFPLLLRDCHRSNFTKLYCVSLQSDLIN